MNDISREISSLRNSLQQLASDRSGWWADVLSCEDLVIAVRGGTLNAYTNGQSIFQIMPGAGGGPPIAKVHYKYLLRPKSTNAYVRLVAGKFVSNASDYIQTEYKSGRTLKELIKTADGYSGAEKGGVHAIAQGNGNVLDVEIAFRAPRKIRPSRSNVAIIDSLDDGDKISTHRIDLAAIHPSATGARIVFYEAKCANNVELWRLVNEGGAQEIEVVTQILRYEAFLKRANSDLIAAYTEVCKTLVWLSQQGWKRRSPLNPLIFQVAKEGGIKLSIHPSVHLLVFDFDAATRDNALRKQIEAIEAKIGARVIAKGNPKTFRLLNDIERCERR